MSGFKFKREIRVIEKIWLSYLVSNPRITQREAASKLNISQPLLNKLLKKRGEIEVSIISNENISRKRKRCGKDSEVENANITDEDICLKNS